MKKSLHTPSLCDFSKESKRAFYLLFNLFYKLFIFLPKVACGAS